MCTVQAGRGTWLGLEMQYPPTPPPPPPHLSASGSFDAQVLGSWWGQERRNMVPPWWARVAAGCEVGSPGAGTLGDIQWAAVEPAFF